MLRQTNIFLQKSLSWLAEQWFLDEAIYHSFKLLFNFADRNYNTYFIADRVNPEYNLNQPFASYLDLNSDHSNLIDDETSSDDLSHDTYGNKCKKTLLIYLRKLFCVIYFQSNFLYVKFSNMMWWFMFRFRYSFIC